MVSFETMDFLFLCLSVHTSYSSSSSSAAIAAAAPETDDTTAATTTIITNSTINARKINNPFSVIFLVVPSLLCYQNSAHCFFYYSIIHFFWQPYAIFRVKWNYFFPCFFCLRQIY